MKKLFLPPKSAWKNELTALIKQNVSGVFAGEGAYSLFLDSGYREVSPVRIDFGLHGIQRFVEATAFVFKSSACSFHGHFAACFVKMSHNKIAARRRLLKSGRADRIRTCDLFVPNEARYQPALQLVDVVGRSLRAERRFVQFFLFAAELNCGTVQGL